MYDWKKEFKLHILARGLDYSRTGKILQLNTQLVSVNGAAALTCSAQVEGSSEAPYEVTMEMNALRVRNMSCTCPHAKKGENCKHMAAVLFQLEAEGKLLFPYTSLDGAGGFLDKSSPVFEEGKSEEEILLDVLKDRLVSDKLLKLDQFDEAVKRWQSEYQVELSGGVNPPAAKEDLEASLEKDRKRREAFEKREESWNSADWNNQVKPERQTEGKKVTELETQTDDDKSLEELLAELDNLVGLEQVKKDIHTLINFVKINKIRAERGLKQADVSCHLVFSGNPGTGKTTVARLLAKLYQKIGVLSQGHLVEVDRSGLIAGYLGQTAIKTAEVIEEAMGGILFIDEAYSLAADDQDSYGKECISTILKAMEDHRDDFIVIVAGYDNLMHQFIDSNPGLRSRFNKYFHFPDYTGEEMEKIFLLQCRSNGYEICAEAQELLRVHFDKMYAQRDDNFGNGRDVRNVFENIINVQANRLAMDPDLTTEELVELTSEDVKKVIDTVTTP